jgi:hypothetical protein
MNGFNSGINIRPQTHNGYLDRTSPSVHCLESKFHKVYQIVNPFHPNSKTNTASKQTHTIVNAFACWFVGVGGLDQDSGATDSQASKQFDEDERVWASPAFAFAALQPLRETDSLERVRLVTIVEEWLHEKRKEDTEFFSRPFWKLVGGLVESTLDGLFPAIAQSALANGSSVLLNSLHTSKLQHEFRSIKFDECKLDWDWAQHLVGDVLQWHASRDSRAISPFSLNYIGN